MGEDSITPAQRIVVLGVGNLLWADEGFGVRCVEALGDGWDFSPPIEILDGGTLGLAPVPLLLNVSTLPSLETVRVVVPIALPPFFCVLWTVWSSTCFNDRVSKLADPVRG